MIKKTNSDAAGAAIAINKIGTAKVYTAIVYIVTGLIAGVGYLLLSCVPEPPPSADSPENGVKNDATAPGAPQNLVLSATKMGEIVARWDAPDVANAKKKDGEPLTAAEVSYAVYYLEKPSSGTKTAAEVKTEAASANPAQAIEVEKGTLTATISGLTIGTTYYVVVEAINSTDTTKRTLIASPMMVAMTLAAAPTAAPVITAQVEGEKTDTQIVVHWNAISADGAKKPDGTAAAVVDLELEVYYTTTSTSNAADVIQQNNVVTVAATETSAAITGLAGATTYYVAARVVVKPDRTKYIDSASVVAYQTLSQAAAPTNAPVITAQVEAEKADSQIVVHWNAISADGAKKPDGTAAAVADLEVAVYYSSTNPNNNVAAVITGTPAKTVAATGTSATITGLAGGSTYYVALRLQVKDDVTKYRDGTSVAQYITTGIAPYPLFDAWSSSGNVVLYTSEAAVGALGPAIRDAILADTTPIATITALDAGLKFTYTLGSSTGTIAADGAGKLVITKSHVKTTDASDGAQLTINKEGGDASTAKVVAVYRPTQLFVWQDLQAMRGNLAANYILQKDIQFPDLNTDGFPAEGFAPIGSAANKFTGTLDGNGKTITGLSIQRPAVDHVGLLGYIEGASGATEMVKNLVLHNASVTGKEYVGALVGQLQQGTVKNVAVTVDESQRNTKRVYGSGYVGGLAGLAGYKSATVIGYTTVDVSGTSYIGGLVGFLALGTTATGYVTGHVSGNEQIGGLTGYNYSGTSTGYALGGVTGNVNVGGLVGTQTGGSVTGYARGVVTRSSGASGLFAPIVVQNQGGIASSIYYSGRAGKYNVVSVDGSPLTPGNTDGSAVTVSATTAQTAFANFTFGADLGQWVWVADGKWPALNLGFDTGGAATARQPVDPHLSASTVAAPSFGTVTPTATTIPLTWGALSLPTNAKQANGAALTLADGVAIELYYLADAATAKTAAEIMAGTQFSGYLDGTATSATLTGLTASTKYHVLLRVVNKSDVSKATDVIKAYTTAAP